MESDGRGDDSSRDDEMPLWQAVTTGQACDELRPWSLAAVRRLLFGRGGS